MPVFQARLYSFNATTKVVSCYRERESSKIVTPKSERSRYTVEMPAVNLSLSETATTTKAAEVSNSSAIDVKDNNIKFLIPICEAVNIALLCLVSWTLLCMLVYGKVTRKWRVPSSERAKLDGGKIYIACIIAVAWSLPRLATSHLLFHHMFLPYCETIMDVGVVAYYIVMWQVYFFLWLRHRAIYAHPTVKNLMGKYANTVSWAMMVLLSLISLGVLCGFTIPHSYKLTHIGCVISENIDGAVEWNVSANLILGAFLVLSQATFLGLFIYPMVITKKMRQQSLSSSARTTPKRRSVRLKGGASCIGDGECVPVRRRLGSMRNKDNVDSISSTLLRSVIGASIAVTSDLVVALLAAFFIPGTIPRSITVTIYDVSLVISLLGIMATFGANKNILFMFCTKTKTSRTKSTESIRSRTLSTEIFD